MQYLERELRATGNTLDGKLADIMANMRKARGKDIPLPKDPRVAIPKEERPTEAKRFSDEAQEALNEKGYVIYALTGQSINSLRESGCKFSSDRHKDYQYFEASTSRRSEVAILYPGQPYIFESRNEDLSRQETFIAHYGEYGIETEINGIKAIMGNAPDYIELALTHLKATGERLFGEKYGSAFVRTKSKIKRNDYVVVGNFDKDKGLEIGHLNAKSKSLNVFAVPLIIPKIG